MSLVERLDWDSSFFGLPIGRVSPSAGPTDLGDVVREAVKHRLRCIYLQASADNHVLISAAQANDFVVREVRIELERPVKGHPVGCVGLRAGRPADLFHLAQIARERFRTTRFFADEGFPRDRSAELYVEWLRRGLMEDAEQRCTLVTEDMTGFVVCHLDNSSGTGRIELIGVAADATRRGLGDVLMAGAGSLFVNASLTTALVVTQGCNVAAKRLYQRHGYRTVRTYLWLHRWLPASATDDQFS